MRRLMFLAGVASVIGAIAVTGNALARGGSTESPQTQQTTLTAQALSKGEPFTTKIEVARAKGEVLAVVAVEVQGEKVGFIVDTGAARSAVSEKFAKQFGLKKVGKPVKIAAAGCIGTAQNVQIDNWKIDGHTLPGLTIASSNLQVANAKLVGLLGSDVWSKFGSLEIDYANETLTAG